MNRSLSIIILLPALLLIASCGKEAVNEGEGSMTITFVPSEIVSVTESETRAGKYEPVPVPVVSDMPLEEPLFLYTTEEDGIAADGREGVAVGTRGTPVASVSQSFSFGVSEFTSGGTAVTSFQNVAPTYESISGSTAVFNSGKRWEAGAYTGTAYEFHAYSPYLSATTNGLTLNSGNKTISYNMSSVSAANQPDLLTAYASSDYIAAPVGLAFGHRLCAIRIKLGTNWRTGFSVTSVKFKSIYTQGTITIQDGTWSLTGSKVDYTVSGLIAPAPTSAGGEVVGASTTYLMMVPQTLSGASLEITLKDSADKSYTLSASITGTWTAGKTVTYTVNPVGITSMTATYPPQWTPSEGSTKTYGPVSSYLANSDQFGLYAVKDGSLILSNIPVGVSSVSGQVATLSLPSNYYLPKTGTTYFLYYPYKSSPGTVTASGTSADAFFTSVISNWSVATSQSTLANYKAQDLQVAMGSGTSPVTFSMAHKMSLAKIVLKNESVTTSRGYNGSTGTTTNSGTTSVTPGNTFSTSYTVPYNSSNTYYCIAKYNAKPSVVDASTTEYAKWSSSTLVIQNASSNALGSGIYREFTIRSRAAARGFVNYQAYFPYSGAGKQFKAPVAGTYKFECWGATGGGNSGNYGKGAYVYGNLNITSTSTVYWAFSGGSGDYYDSYYGVFNGGGNGYHNDEYNNNRSGGGGCSDIRLSGNDLTTRIMVAGGGGGAGYRGFGGYGGAPDGTDGIPDPSYSGTDCSGKGAKNGTFGLAGPHDTDFGSSPTNGTLHSGGNGTSYYGGGGGGGHYGGGGAGIQRGGRTGGGGGSSYINTSYFSNRGWIRADQSGYPTNPGGNNGYVRITFVSQ